MCKVKGCEHTLEWGKGALLLLVEGDYRDNACEARLKYLSVVADKYIEWAKDQHWYYEGYRARTVSRHLDVLREKWPENQMQLALSSKNDELRDEGLLDTKYGLEDLDSRMDDECSQQGKLEGMYHNIAYQTWRKNKDMESLELFEERKAWLEKLEEQFDMNRLREKRLSKNCYRLACKFRAGINMRRFKLRSLSYGHWAYLTNWLNVLMSNDKQYTCEEQNVFTDRGGLAFIDPEDVEAEIIQVYYTRD